MEDNKENNANVSARLSIVNGKLEALKLRATQDAETMWALGSKKDAGFDCDAVRPAGVCVCVRVCGQPCEPLDLLIGVVHEHHLLPLNQTPR